jgi:hypothetical protein
MPAPLPDIIRALLDPAAYDHPAAGVELIQTHISYVLLAGDFAYKIKKPLDLGFLDYSTLARRKFLCEEEVRLNRRLCSGVYLGVVAVVAAGAPGFRIGAPGKVAEYAVKMHRVPPGRMMPALLERGAVTPADIRTIAHKMAQFHRASAADGDIARFGRADAVRQNIQDNFDQTERFIGRTVSREQYDAIVAFVDTFLRDRRALIERRADEGRVRDCHGDLRSDSIVIGENSEVCVMDCIEFSDRLRFGDVADDMAFLSMDLEFRGRRDLADELAAAYLGEANDETLPLVWSLYRCYRAYVRGKVDSLLLDEPEVPDNERERARLRATAYFDLAHRYATESYPPALVMMIGLSGTGKSYVAGALAARIGAALVRSDVVRKQAAGIDPTTPMRAAIDTGIYADAARASVYPLMHARARDYLGQGQGVVLDATYISRANRAAARRVAADAGVPFLAIEVTATEDLVRDRLAARQAQPGAASDADWQVYLAQRRRLEPPTELPPAAIVRIGASQPLVANIDAAVAALRPSAT